MDYGHMQHCQYANIFLTRSTLVPMIEKLLFVYNINIFFTTHTQTAKHPTEKQDILGKMLTPKI